MDCPNCGSDVDPSTQKQPSGRFQCPCCDEWLALELETGPDLHSSASNLVMVGCDF